MSLAYITLITLIVIIGFIEITGYINRQNKLRSKILKLKQLEDFQLILTKTELEIELLNDYFNKQ